VPNFCDCLSPHDLFKREQQLSVLRAFARKGWQPPKGEDDGVPVDAVTESREELVKLMCQKPKSKQGALGKR